MPAARRAKAEASGSGSVSGAASLTNARRKAGSSGSSAAAPPTLDATSTTPLPLPVLLQHLTAHHTLRLAEALPIAGGLVRAKLHAPRELCALSPMALQDAGIAKDDEEKQRRVCAVFGRGKVAKSKIPKPLDDVALAREYGSTAALSSAEAEQGLQLSYDFAPVLDPADLETRYVHINRAVVLCAWAEVLLERLGFARREALSLAHAYIQRTSAARARTLGLPHASSAAVDDVGPSQPHFVLMRVKLPLMKLENGEWRALSEGSVVSPDRAFSYLRKTLLQNLPRLYGALVLLADSWLEPGKVDLEGCDASAEALHARAWGMYCDFRPETGGEWGKKETVHLGKVLELRRPKQEEEAQPKEERKEPKLDLEETLLDDWMADEDELAQELKEDTSANAAVADQPAEQVKHERNAERGSAEEQDVKRVKIE